jgi:hypothetical protein
MIDKDEELHAELLRVFRRYFEENQRWFAEDTYSSTIRLRHLLRSWQIEKREQLDERKIVRAQKGGRRGKRSNN